MFSSVVDFFCSRLLPKTEGVRSLWLTWLPAFVFGVLAFVVGAVLCGDFALPGEHTVALSALSRSPLVMAFVGPRNVLWASHPMLWGLTGLLGEAPTMGALNLLGAGIFGVTTMLTWQVVYFWCRDSLSAEPLGTARLRAFLAACAACLLLIFFIPGYYTATSLTFNAWGFMLLLAAVVVQNAYAIREGNRALLALSGLLMGLGALESPVVLVMLPVLFFRMVMLEWRLWDHSVRQLPWWVLGFAAGAAALFLLNGWRVTGSLSPSVAWAVEREVIAGVVVPTVLGWFQGAWLIALGGALFLPLAGWGIARCMLCNIRTWGLFFGGLLVTASLLGVLWGILRVSPWALWMAAGQIPVAAHWTIAAATGMLLVGWGVLLFANNAYYEDPDTREVPLCVTVSKVGALVLLPLGILFLGFTSVRHTGRFLAVDRGMATRFAEETVSQLQADGRTYLLGSYSGWIDPHVAMVARQKGYPLVVISPILAGHLEKDELPPDTDAERLVDQTLRAHTYGAWLRERLQQNEDLGGGDRWRLVHLLDYDLYAFVKDFFRSQANVERLAAAYDLPDVWFALDTRNLANTAITDRERRALPRQTYYIGAPGRSLADKAVVDEAIRVQAELQKRWAPVLAEPYLPYWDLTRAVQGDIRRHVGFMANNLGVWLNDQSELAGGQAVMAEVKGDQARAAELRGIAAALKDQAAAHYDTAYSTDKANLSAMLNLYYLCTEERMLPHRLPELERDMQALVKRLQERQERYSFAGVGRFFGYIRNYAAYSKRGWDWAAQAAPEATLSSLSGLRATLRPGDLALSNVNAASAAVYELHGQIESSEELYQEVLQADPENYEALRGMVRLALQRGRVQEAGQYLARAERVDQANAKAFHTTVAAVKDRLDRADACLIRDDFKGAEAALGLAPKASAEQLQAELERLGDTRPQFRSILCQCLAVLAMRAQDMPGALRQLEAARQALALVKPPLTPLVFDRAAYLMANGDLDGAEQDINAYVKANPTALDGYAMLAMIAVDRGDRALNAGASDKAAEHYRSAELLLPKLTELSTKPDDAYFELIIRGRLAQSQAIQADELLADSGRRHWMDARSFYKRAYDLRPRIRNRMLEFILNIDRRLGDKAQAEKDALEILIDEPSNPYANFVIGTQRLEDGNFREARLYFAQAYNALGQGSDLSLINNYAEALTRSDDPADHALAERIIREPTFQHPGNHLLRATYALTLARNGKVAEAQETLRQARDIAEKLGIVIDPRIAFVEAWIAASQKNVDEVDRILRTLRTALGPDATPRDRHDFRAIREAAKQ